MESTSLEAQLNALRSKYAPLAAERDSRDTRPTDGLFVPSGSVATTSAATATHAKCSVAISATTPECGAPNRPGICTECRGSGVTSTVYNHRVMERTCRLCEGEGVIASVSTCSSSNPAVVAASTAEARGSAPEVSAEGSVVASCAADGYGSELAVSRVSVKSGAAGDEGPTGTDGST